MPHPIILECLTFKHVSQLTFQAIRHEKLNQLHNPCEPYPVYTLAYCIEEYIVRQANCQPHWRKYSFEGVPTCNNWTMLSRYDKAKWDITVMGSEEVKEATGCLFPCTYMEYKVNSGLSMVHGLE